MFGDSPEFLTGLHALGSSISLGAHRASRGGREGELGRAVCKVLEEWKGKLRASLDKLYKAYCRKRLWRA